MLKMNLNSIKQRFIKIYNRKKPPDEGEFLPVITEASKALLDEDRNIRPRDSDGMPGGLLNLKKYIPTIIMPDLHARMDFFLNVLFYKDGEGITSIQKLAGDELQIVCVGDGFHAESREMERWKEAHYEYLDGYSRHSHMDKEMKESMGLMEMVMETKSAFPENFHFLKGNHENISNEQGEGNYPFRKFALEGPMVASYVAKFFSEEFLRSYYIFEKQLPLFAVGKNFLISHAEPKRFFSKNEIVNYRRNPDIIEGLTWTDNNQAEHDSVLKMLEYYLGNEGMSAAYYFGGHRPVKDYYNKRADGKYIQIHNPSKFIIAQISAERDIILDHDIFELQNRTKEIIQG